MTLSSEQLFDIMMELLNKTTPYKHEKLITHLLPDCFVDPCGNYWYQVGENSTSLFCCHLDTVGSNPEFTEPFYRDGFIYSLAFNPSPSCLGGDDRCGILCLLAMINANVPGTYLFHVGEEKGTIGADYIAKQYDLSQFKRAIEFDRRGTTSVITCMMGFAKVCSDEFSNELCKQLGLGFKADDTGLFTDVFSYNELIPEITNLSVGYYHEHSCNEKINIDWLIDEFIPALYGVDWDNLPVVRDPAADNAVNSMSSWDTYLSRGSNSHTHNENSRGINRNYGYTWDKNDLNKDSFELDDDGNLKYNDSDSIANDESLSVFDEKEFFGACNFCGDSNTDDIDEIFFEGKSWILCKDCKEYLLLDDELLKRDAADKEYKKSLEEKEQAVDMLMSNVADNIDENWETVRP